MSRVCWVVPSSQTAARQQRLCLWLFVISRLLVNLPDRALYDVRAPPKCLWNLLSQFESLLLFNIYFDSRVATHRVTMPIPPLI